MTIGQCLCGARFDLEPQPAGAPVKCFSCSHTSRAWQSVSLANRYALLAPPLPESEMRAANPVDATWEGAR